MLPLQHWGFSLMFLSILTGVSCGLTPSKKAENSLEDSSVTLSYKYSEMSSSDYFFWYRQYPGKPPELLISHSASGQVGNELIPGLKIEVKDKIIYMIISSAKLSDSAVYYCALRPTVTGNTKTLYKLDVEKKGCPSERLFSCSFYCSGGTLIICCLFGFNNSKDMLLYLFLLFSPFIALGSMNSIKPESSEEHVAEGRNINLTCTYEGAIYSIQWYRQYQRSRPEFLLYITEGGSIHPTGSDFSAHIDKTRKRVDLEIISAKVTDSAVYYCALTSTVTGNTKTLYKNLWSKDNTILHNVHQRES
ncbi:uncharacterized protein LOC117953901, partial [Etheostoma cragini]|uniref:uncharacterized protein LOC117953901 n=1 Tax=Etheostoma cragini TaxID=417921 RepID=UPI00155EFC01